MFSQSHKNHLSSVGSGIVQKTFQDFLADKTSPIVYCTLSLDDKEFLAQNTYSVELHQQYKQYFTVKNWDYKDIVDYIQSNEGTVHLAALVIKKAKSILENHCIDYSECKKEAVYVTYYKQGDNYVKKFLDKKKKDTKHNIIPGEGCRVAKQRKKFLEIFL